MSRIEIPKLPTIKHSSPFFRDGFLSMTIVGKSGCGKTQMLASILPGISPSIKTVIIATVVKNVPVHLAIKEYFTKKGIYSAISYDPMELRGFVEYAEKIGHVSLERQGLIIFDDFNTGRATGPYWEFIIHAFTKLRNSGWNFIILSQQPSFIPTIVRNCTTSRILFDCYSKSALSTFTRDVVDRIPDRGAYDTLLDYIQKVPYSYVLVQEHPFEVSAGSLDKFRPVMNENIVMMPTLRELMSEMGVKSREALDTKSARLQAQAGNTAPQLDGIAHRATAHLVPDSEGMMRLNRGDYRQGY